MKKEVTGWDFFSLALTAFAGLGLEVLLAFWLEPFLYGIPMQEWNVRQNITHWIITCILWGIIAYLLICSSKKDLSFDLFQKTEKKKLMLWQWIGIIFCITLSLFESYMSWNGSKILREFQHLGPLLFIFQYIYYIFETILFMLIILFAQKAFEVWGEKIQIPVNFPYGGIICGLTWGLGHIFSKGSVLIGLEGLVLGFLMGFVYLLVNRDVKKTYLILAVMFIL